MKKSNIESTINDFWGDGSDDYSWRLTPESNDEEIVLDEEYIDKRHKELNNYETKDRKSNRGNVRRVRKPDKEKI